MAQALCFFRTLDDLILHGKRQRQDFWGNALHQKPSNRPIQVGARNALIGALSPFNTFVLTEIVGNNTLTPTLVIAHGHAFSTPATDEESLQERRPLAWWGKALGSIR